MNENNPVVKNPILGHFLPWSNISCWVVCNEKKQPTTIHPGQWLIPRYETDIVPISYKTGELLRWKTEPQDHIVELQNAYGISEKSVGFGFGVLLGFKNTLGCFDFDKVLNEKKEAPEQIDQLLDILNTFTEISSSGKGLHAFIGIEGETQEYGFKDSFCDGKFYNNRFIKMTGTIYKDFDIPVRFFDNRDLKEIQKRIGPSQIFTQKTLTEQLPFINGDFECDWPRILLDAGIPFLEAKEYIGKTKSRGNNNKDTHKVLWACRIICPNFKEHTGWRNRILRVATGGGDVAILTYWDDYVTTVVCNHNHCDSEKYKPNLLLKLWTKIKENRADTFRELFKNAGVKI